MKYKKDVSLQMIRIISTFSIVLCHLVQELNSDMLAATGQFFNVGVYIFFVISGYLYGERTFDEKLRFYKGRVLKILVPMWLYIIPLLVISIVVTQEASWRQIFIFLSNTQYWFQVIPGGAHLWFISIIFLCYLFLPLISLIPCKSLHFASLILLVLTGGFLCYYYDDGVGRGLFYVVVFNLGYVIRRYNIRIPCIGLAMLIIVSVVFRLLAKHYWDGTIMYNNIIVAFTHTAFALGFFGLCIRFLKCKPSKIIDWFDQMSYPIYITHYTFFVGTFRTMDLTGNMILNVLGSLFFAILTACILQLFVEKLGFLISKMK